MMVKLFVYVSIEVKRKKPKRGKIQNTENLKSLSLIKQQQNYFRESSSKVSSGEKHAKLPQNLIDDFRIKKSNEDVGGHFGFFYNTGNKCPKIMAIIIHSLAVNLCMSPYNISFLIVMFILQFFFLFGIGIARKV